MHFPIAVQLFSFRDCKDIPDVLVKLKKMGFDGVELAGFFGYSPADAKMILDETGLVPISAHVCYDEIKANPEGVMKLYSSVGIKYITLPFLMPENIIDKDRFKEIKENILYYSSLAREYGLMMLYHNHDFDFTIHNGEYLLDLLMDSIPDNLLQTELDVCMIKLGGENPAKFINKYSGRCPVIHYKDFFGTYPNDPGFYLPGEDKAPTRPTDLEYRPIGSGLQNFEPIIEATKNSGTEWIIVEQDSPSMGLDQIECMQKSIKYLNRQGC